MEIDEERLRRIDGLKELFERESAIDEIEIDDLVDLLQGNAAFVELLRFTKGGLTKHLQAFKNDNAETKIRSTFKHLMFGKGDYLQRIYDCVFLPEYKLSHWGQNCTFELFGWINQDGVPPINGRIMKALRYLGLDVPV